MTDPMSEYEASHGMSIYDAMGGESGLQAVVAAFYRHMADDADLRELRVLHNDLAHAETRLFEFLSGRFGGPNLYWERHGHPRLRRRHMPFAIGAVERDQWLLGMQRALDEQAVNAELASVLMGFFTHIAHKMQNRA